MKKEHSIITREIIDYLDRQLMEAKTCVSGLDGINAYIHLGNALGVVNGLYNELVETNKVT